MIPTKEVTPAFADKFAAAKPAVTRGGWETK